MMKCVSKIRLRVYHILTNAQKHIFHIIIKGNLCEQKS